MKTLALLRHAKSDWSDARARDFDRPLNDRGVRGARAMGEYIKSTCLRFERILASPAVRVAETIEEASKAWGHSFPVEWDRRIYLASSATLIDLLRELSGEPASVLVPSSGTRSKIRSSSPGLCPIISTLAGSPDSSRKRSISVAELAR